MNETRLSDDSPTDVLRFSYVPAEAFHRMHPVWRALKLEELGGVESLWDTKQPEAFLPKAEKWAASNRDTVDLSLAAIPLETTDSLHKKLIRGCSSPNGEALTRLSAILGGILDRFEPGGLLAALDRDLRLCSACGPAAIFVNSELEVISANILVLRHFGRARRHRGGFHRHCSARLPMVHGSTPMQSRIFAKTRFALSPPNATRTIHPNRSPPLENEHHPHRL